MTSFIAAMAFWSCSAGEMNQWRTQLTDGEVVESPLQSIDGSNLLLGKHGRIAGRRVVSLERIGSPRPAWPTEAHLVFVNGDRLVGTPIECDQRIVLFDTSISNSPMKVPLSRVDSIWFAPPLGTRTASSFDHLKRDRIAMKNGDRLSGTITALVKEEKQLKMEIESKSKSIPTDQLISIHLNSELHSDRVPEQAYWQCTLRNGSRLSLLSIRIADERITGQTLFKAEVAIPFEEVVAIDRIRGAAIWLSSLKPSRFESTPYFNETLSWYGDRNEDGRQLALRDAGGVRYFDRGISMPSKSELTYSLDGRYEWFFAEVGLDPRLGKEGNVDVSLSLDGQRVDLPNLKGLTLKRGTVPVRLKLNGAKRLTLEVDWGEGGPVEDVVNWGQATLIQKQ